jgi:hypothetical protein
MSDNATLKQLSAESHKVALAATRDSAAMRTLTEFTILFLPGTAVAVGFNMLLQPSSKFGMLLTRTPGCIQYYNLRLPI